MNSTSSKQHIGEGQRLDPQDWNVFGNDMHKLLDSCLERMQDVRNKPWIPPAEDSKLKVALNDVQKPKATADVFDMTTKDIMPYAGGNTHPRFWGWVHGCGLPVAVGAEIVAATMNCNAGGRRHISAEVEVAVIDWLLSLCNLQGTVPRQSAEDKAFGAIVTGTSQATILAFNCARQQRFGAEVRVKGNSAFPDVAFYAVKGAHSCMARALECCGYGSRSLRLVPAEDGKMNMTVLAEMVAADKAAGIVPMCVVATAGSVNLGEFDNLNAISDFCKENEIWMHIDAAFGFWMVLGEQRLSHLVSGMDNACSIALDFHKWMGVPYDCGAFMCYSKELQRDTFTSRPAYLAQAVGEESAGMAGGDHWMCDYSLELSRGFRALKVWVAIQTVGTDAYSALITDNCNQAEYLGELVKASPVLTLAKDVISNIVCFYPTQQDQKLAPHSGLIAARLQLKGTVTFTTTIIDGRETLRAAFVNHRTTHADVELSVRAVEEEIAAHIAANATAAN